MKTRNSGRQIRDHHNEVHQLPGWGPVEPGPGSSVRGRARWLRLLHNFQIWTLEDAPR